MAGFVNNVLFTPTLGGTTDWVVSAAVGGFNTPAGAGAVDGMTYKYRAESADLSQWEVGEGIYTSGTTTLTRASVSLNSLGTTAKINFSTVPQVGIVTLAQDLLGVDQSNSWSTTQQAMARLTNLNAGIADLWERVGAEPSLDLLADDIAAMFTTTRASTGTYFDADGLLKTAAANVPRVQYNPVTRQNEGYLYESGATNLLVRSQEFDNASWGKIGATITANAITAPDGTLTADKLVENTSTGGHIAVGGFSVTSGVLYVASCFLKAAGRGFAFLTVNTGFPVTAISVNLTTGAVTSAVGTPLNAVCTVIGDGWYRASFYVAATSTTTASVNVYNSADGVWANRNYLGDGASGVYLWGAMVEGSAAASYATSYIPTTSATVARSADVPTLATDTSWFNLTEGTFLIDMTPLGLQAGAAAELISFDDGASTNHYRIRFGSVIAGADFTVSSGGVNQVDTGSFGVTAARGRYSFAYAVNDFAFTKDGQTVLTDVSGSLAASITRLVLGLNQGGAHRVHRVAYWPKRLTNAQLQLLTAVS